MYFQATVLRPSNETFTSYYLRCKKAREKEIAEDEAEISDLTRSESISHDLNK